MTNVGLIIFGFQIMIGMFAIASAISDLEK